MRTTSLPTRHPRAIRTAHRIDPLRTLETRRRLPRQLSQPVGYKVTKIDDKRLKDLAGKRVEITGDQTR